MITILKNYFQSYGVIQRVGSHFPVSTAYYLKFVLRAKSFCDYVDGLLSLAYIQKIAVVDMAHIVAKHPTSTRKDDAKYYGKGDKGGTIFSPFNGRVADPD